MNKVLSMQNVSIAFGQNPVVQVVDALHLDLHAGEVYCLVGESGCGKSVSASAILRLLPTPGATVQQGNIWFEGADLLQQSLANMRQIRGKKISMIFQDPGAALNPVLTIGKQLAHFELAQVQKMLVTVGLSNPERILSSYVHELSGGMLQRIMIAMALLPSPQVLIADEPTTALDVTVQAQVMELLTQLAASSNTAVLLITHNLNLVAQYGNRVGVMYAGRMVEEGYAQKVLAFPQHPYTQGLLRALPQMDSTKIEPIPGQVPAPSEFVQGCRFANRCKYKQEQCAQKPPFENGVACFYPLKNKVGVGCE